MRQKTFTLGQIAELTQSRLHGDPQYKITGFSDLETASMHDVSFLANVRYAQALSHSQAGAVFIDQASMHEGRNFLVHESPSKAFQMILDLFLEGIDDKSGFTGIHAAAVVHPTAAIGSHVNIGPHAVIDQHVKIGAGTTIGAGCYIGPSTTIGENCFLHPNVTIRERCSIGNKVIIQSGAVIGSCGFGYIPDKEGNHIKLTQYGTVTIEDDVEIGANTTIDRSRFKTTRIGRGSKIDNLVQIAHGVEIGAHNIIVAQVGIAGSTKTGKYVILAGKVALAGHIELGDHVIVSAFSGVSKSLPKAGKYGGIPAIPLNEHNRNQVLLRKHLKQMKE